jgi:hypothetical protein
MLVSRPRNSRQYTCYFGDRTQVRFLLLLSVVSLLSGALFGQQTIVFAHYNIENYLEQDRREGGQVLFGPKPEGEKNTLVRIIKEIHPDILGVAEMGPEDQFADFQHRLEGVDLHYPFTEYVNGPDPARHIALLSRFEIAERHSENRVEFNLNGQRSEVQRGFLDVTVQVTPSYRLRIVGAHLKIEAARSCRRSPSPKERSPTASQTCGRCSR